MNTRRLAILISAIYFAAMPVQADLVFQPKKGKKIKQWREAGSNLLTGIARIFDGLAAVESQDSKWRGHLDAARVNLKKAGETYSSIAASVAPEKKTSIESLDPTKKAAFQEVFRKYDLVIPVDEHGAAQTAANESKRLETSLEKLTEQIGNSDSMEVQTILAAITRVEQLGTATRGTLDV